MLLQRHRPTAPIDRKPGMGKVGDAVLLHAAGEAGRCRPWWDVLMTAEMFVRAIEIRIMDDAQRSAVGEGEPPTSAAITIGEVQKSTCSSGIGST